MSDTPARRAAPGLCATGVTKEFGPVQALQGIDLVVPRGTIVALLGHNGAGKTTLTRVLATLTAPSGGRAQVAGYDVVAEAPEVRRRIGLVSQFSTTDAELTGRENLVLAAQLGGLPAAIARDRSAKLLDEFSLGDDLDRRAGTYSGGMRRKLDIAAALVVEPEVLFLDEPTTGLDPETRRSVFGLVRQAREAGTTILLTTQYLDEADQLADTLRILDHGKVVAAGTPSELKAALGGITLQVVAADPADTPAVASLLGPWVETAGGLATDRAAGSVRAPLTHATTAVDALAAITSSGVRIADATLTPPSLDDAYLFFTSNGDRQTASRTPTAPTTPITRTTPTTPGTTSPQPPRSAGHSAAQRGRQTYLFVKRNLTKVVRTPSIVVVSMVQPALFTFVLAFVIATVAQVPGVDYKDFVLPAAMIQALVVGAMATGTGLAIDNAFGMLERFRSLPIWAGAVFVGRAGAGAVRTTVQTLVLFVLSFAVGFRVDDGPVGVATMLGVFVVTATVVACCSCALATRVPNLEAFQVLSFLPVLPLLYVSSAFAPIDQLPSALRPIAEVNPVTAATGIVRYVSIGETGGGSLELYLASFAVWSLALIAGSLRYGIRHIENRST